ncbi:MAG TPA: BTAD domain-containing putative transcriptional regulator [Kineosporiaceae bacterium]|nr:BTAD domain-containing putative transcriptional regulator [Kineosporiaceae bacterium]
MRVGVLGPLLIDAGAGPASIAGARLRGLLVRLALDAGRPVRADLLVQALWGEDEPAVQANALQSLASRLRRVLGDGALVTSDPAGYRLAVDPGAVDAIRFERLADGGRRALAAGDPGEASDQLHRALGLWRGTALADVRNAPFAPAQATRLERRRLAALEDRIDADLTLGRADQVVVELETLAVANPTRERLQAQLLRALAATGRAAEAVARYETLRRLLADELGADPGAELQAAHLAVLRGDVPVAAARSNGRAGTGPEREQDRPTHGTASAPDRESAQHPAGAAAAHRGNLTAPLTSFVGRDGDVARLVDLLQHDRLVTLVGPGGAGKTRLASEVGRRLAPAASDGVWFVPLAPVGSADDVPRAVLDALNARESALLDQSSNLIQRPDPDDARAGSAREVLDRLVEILTHRGAVVVLDNCEHVVGAAAALAESLLGRCPRLRILATSREPLHILGETLHPVSPLGLPEPGCAPGEALRFPAVRLFADRAAAVRPGFAVDAGAVRAVVEICRRLDGLPLAIELAAARLRTLPVEVIAVRLEDRFRLLTGGSRTALPRHQTLRAVVAWSWDLLDRDERALIERLAVLPGGFAEDAAIAVGGFDLAPGVEVAELLAALVDKSLLQVTDAPLDGGLRYRMLETIREYGIDRLGARDEIASVRGRQCRFFLALADRAEPHLREADQLTWLRRLALERDNLLAAIRWAIESRDADTAFRLGADLSWYWTLRGSHHEALTWLGAILEVPGDAPPVARAVVVSVHAMSELAVRSGTSAGVAMERIVDAVRDVDVSLHPVLALAGPVVSMMSADRAAAVAAFDDLDDQADPWTRAALLLVKGLLAENGGQVELARDALARALEGFRALGERWGTAAALTALGGLLPLSGDIEGALAMHDEAARYSRELGADDDAAQMELRMSLMQAQIGDPVAARRRIEELLDDSGEFDSVHGIALGYLALAELDVRGGQLDHARANLLEALRRIDVQTGAPPQITAMIISWLVQVDAALGRLDDAPRWLDRPQIASVLRWDMPVAARIAVAVATLESVTGSPAQAALLLGAATAIRGADDRSDIAGRDLAVTLTAVLGQSTFTTSHAAGTAMTQSRAQDLVSATIAGFARGSGD